MGFFFFLLVTATLLIRPSEQIPELRGIRIYEVPVVYRARSREAGKKLTPVDGLRVLRTLLRCRVA